MKFGVCLPTFRYGAEPSVEHVTAVARRAEEIGYESVWAGDHILVPSEAVRMRFFADPLVTLAYVAGTTDRIKLGTSVVVAPLRNPMVLAKQAATLDYLSAGRLILGLGGGWLKREFDYLGAGFADRGKRFDETIRVLRCLFSESPAQFAGEFWSFDDAVLEPRPVHPNGPPIWIGGSSERAFRRVAELGDAWHADDTPPEAVAEAGDRIRVLAEPHRRCPEVTTRVTVRVGDTESDAAREGYYRAGDAYSGVAGSGKMLREQVDEFRRVGSTHFIAQFEHRTVEEHLAALEAFANDVIGPLGATSTPEARTP